MTGNTDRRQAAQSTDPADDNIIELRPFLPAATAPRRSKRARPDPKSTTVGRLLSDIAEDVGDHPNARELIAILDDIGMELGLELNAPTTIATEDRACDAQASKPWPTPVADADGELYAQMADDVAAAVDQITSRSIQKTQSSLADNPDHAAEIAGRLLDFRRDLHRAAAWIVEEFVIGRDHRVERVRETLGLHSRDAAVFLLQLVDEPERSHACLSGSEHSRGSRGRQASVYVSHIRRALRGYGLAEAVVTIRSRGYQLSVDDARLISELWGE